MAHSDMLGDLVDPVERSLPQQDSERLRHYFARALVEPGLTIPEFYSHGRCLRLTTSQDPTERAEAFEQASRLIKTLGHVQQRSHHAVESAIRRFESGGHDVSAIREEALAREFGLDPAHLGRLLQRATGMGFKAWALGARLRPAIQELVGIDYVSQIATRWGWSSASQFDRHFHRLLGLSPRAFRRLIRSDAA